MSCKAIKIPQVINVVKGYGWLFPKHSPLFPLFDLYIRKVIENGSFQRIKDTYYEKENAKPNCPNYEGDPIGTEKTFLLFIIISLVLH